MKNTSSYRTVVKVKDSYNAIQIMDIESWNVKVNRMNELYALLEETNITTNIQHFNKQIELHKEYMKTTKPNWLKGK